MCRPLRARLAPLLVPVGLAACVAPAPIHHVTLVSEPVPAAAPATAPTDPQELPTAVHDHAPGGSDCTTCAALAASPAHPDTGLQPANVGTSCAICAGLRTPPPRRPSSRRTPPGGHGPPPGHGAPPPGAPVTGAGPR